MLHRAWIGLGFAALLLLSGCAGRDPCPDRGRPDHSIRDSVVGNGAIETVRTFRFQVPPGTSALSWVEMADYTSETKIELLDAATMNGTTMTHFTEEAFHPDCHNHARLAPQQDQSLAAEYLLRVTTHSDAKYRFDFYFRDLSA